MNILEKVRNLRIDDYNYPLPDERIAKHPLSQREQCKVLMYSNDSIEEHRFYEVPRLLPAGAMLIYNNTRVINARLRFSKETGSKIEIFCLEPVVPCDYQLIFQTTSQCTWLCLVGNSKRWKSGELMQQVHVDGTTITVSATRGERRGNAFEITFSWDGNDVTFASVLEATCHSYIKKSLSGGGDNRARTDDPLLAKQVLSQLSYTPISENSEISSGPSKLNNASDSPAFFAP